MSLCPHGQAGTNCPACLNVSMLDDDSASLDGVRECLKAATREPIDPGTSHVIDAVLELAEYVERQPVAKGGDARAQLWVRVYAGELEAQRRYHGVAQCPDISTLVPGEVLDCRRDYGLDHACARARKAADAAVRDFDEHYLGGKR